MLSCIHLKHRRTFPWKSINPNTPFCQSCGMPLTDESLLGTEKDGAKAHDYCIYCYKDGAFTSDCTMEQMIDFCVPVLTRQMPGASGGGRPRADEPILPVSQALEEKLISIFHSF